MSFVRSIVTSNIGRFSLAALMAAILFGGFAATNTKSASADPGPQRIPTFSFRLPSGVSFNSAPTGSGGTGVQVGLPGGNQTHVVVGGQSGGCSGAQTGSSSIGTKPSIMALVLGGSYGFLGANTTHGRGTVPATDTVTC